MKRNNNSQAPSEAQNATNRAQIAAKQARAAAERARGVNPQVSLTRTKRPHEGSPINTPDGNGQKRQKIDEQGNFWSWQNSISFIVNSFSQTNNPAENPAKPLQNSSNTQENFFGSPLNWISQTFNNNLSQTAIESQTTLPNQHRSTSISNSRSKYPPIQQKPTTNKLPEFLDDNFIENFKKQIDKFEDFKSDIQKLEDELKQYEDGLEKAESRYDKKEINKYKTLIDRVKIKAEIKETGLPLEKTIINTEIYKLIGEQISKVSKFTDQELDTQIEGCKKTGTLQDIAVIKICEFVKLDKTLDYPQNSKSELAKLEAEKAVLEYCENKSQQKEFLKELIAYKSKEITSKKDEISRDEARRRTEQRRQENGLGFYSRPQSDLSPHSQNSKGFDINTIKRTDRYGSSILSPSDPRHQDNGGNGIYSKKEIKKIKKGTERYEAGQKEKEEQIIQQNRARDEDRQRQKEHERDEYSRPQPMTQYQIRLAEDARKLNAQIQRREESEARSFFSTKSIRDLSPTSQHKLDFEREIQIKQENSIGRTARGWFRKTVRIDKINAQDSRNNWWEKCNNNNSGNGGDRSR